MPPRVIALLRVSTEEQAGPDRFGLAAQRAEVARVAAIHGLEIVETVELAGVSGTAVLADPRFDAMLRRLQEPDVAGVVVAEVSRLTRPERLSDYAILEAFRESGKVLYTPDGPMEFRTFSGRLIGLLKGELGAEERRSIQDRTQRGKAAARREGRHPGGAHTLPQAVHYDRAARAWSYRWPQAGVVREAYRAVLTGERNLTALGARLGLDRHTLREALRHPIYHGWMRWRDGTERQVIDVPLVSRAEWEAVQAALDGRPRPVRREGPPWLYAGLLRCGVCGATVYATHVSRWGDYYRCRSSALVGVGCATGQLVQRAVDAATDAVLGGVLSDRATVRRLVEAAAARGVDVAAVPEANEVARRLAALRAERERVAVSWERGMRTEAAALARCREIDAEAEALVRLAGDRPAERILDVEELALRVARVLRGWDRRPWAERRRLAQATLRAVHVARAGRARVRVARVDLHSSPPGDAHEGYARVRRADFVAIPLS